MRSVSCKYCTTPSPHRHTVHQFVPVHTSSPRRRYTASACKPSPRYRAVHQLVYPSLLPYLSLYALPLTLPHSSSARMLSTPLGWAASHLIQLVCSLHATPRTSCINLSPPTHTPPCIRLFTQPPLLPCISAVPVHKPVYPPHATMSACLLFMRHCNASYIPGACRCLILASTLRFWKNETSAQVEETVS